MKMPTAQILKTALEAGRRRASPQPGNLHIGKTMRDLYANDTDKQSKRLKSLLDELSQREQKADK
ncbi:hypothetical protein [Ensifer sp.]|jgi:hypothetical protein|uniref:hypothetical protein n=1 Tax=Ensifer sp. TaxID=1872086 RepID=UPI002E15FE7F|nr:hypothetical protein [Ensifer sp.]